MQSDECARLSGLRRFQLLDSPPDEAFDRITALAAQFFATPVALISLVDEHRVWFKSRFGFQATEAPRLPGLCASVIAGHQVYVVTNALEDRRTLAHPMVTGPLGVRFYAAAPLVTRDGLKLGAISVLDFKAREFSAAGEQALLRFAALVMNQMESHLSAIEIAQTLNESSRAKSPFADQKMVTVCAWTKKININNEWLSLEEFLTTQLGLSVSHGIEPHAAEEALRDLAARDSTTKSGQQPPHALNALRA